MIPLRRVRGSGSINTQFFGVQLEDISFELAKTQRSIKKGDITKHSFKSSIWKKAKEQLLKESNDKCAYCETPMSVVSYGDVEHYRPKSKYWWLAYCLDNYLASCAICNQKFKSAHFKVEGGKMPSPRVRRNSADSTLKNISKALVPDPLIAADVMRFENKHRAELALLINPYVDDPTITFAWHADRNLEEVDLVAVSSDFSVVKRVDAAKEFYGLDRPQLRGLRYATFHDYFVNKVTLEDPSINQNTRMVNEDAIKRKLRGSSPYAGMIRFFENVGNPEDWITDGWFTV